MISKNEKGAIHHVSKTSAFLSIAYLICQEMSEPVQSLKVRFFSFKYLI